MYNPISTYRIQFHKSFTLKDLEKQIKYLKLLGAGTLYSSPIFKATPGSEHGYDVINPVKFNPEITSKKDFMRIGELLQKENIGWLQDIVPNHMAFHQGNSWLMDVLEKGTLSDFHKIFDLQPGVPGPDNRLMVPFLGSDLDSAIKNQEIKLGWGKGNFTLNYFDNVYPVNFKTFHQIIKEQKDSVPELITGQLRKYISDDTQPDKVFLNTHWEEIKKALHDLYKKNKSIARFIDRTLKKYNSEEKLLHDIHNLQFYELCHWQETEKRINFRRFFTVNGLICLRIEDPVVFDTFHSLIFEMIKKGYFRGLRIDHIDGLKDPNGYLERLRSMTGDNTYIVAEKILESDEDLPEFWPIQGNTGYDFLAMVNNLLTNVEDYQKLRNLYREVTNISSAPSQLIYENKKMILTTRMYGEWDNISKYFNELEFINYNKKGAPGREEIKEAIGEFMLACPVYRLYPRNFPIQSSNRKIIEKIFETAEKRNPALRPALGKLREIVLCEDKKGEAYYQKLALFFARLMQFTGPLMAKGVEDTSMYQYNAFIAHNEVGDALNARGITIDQFHKQMTRRSKKWPLTMNNSSTHDTKRGEDVRARLNVISELASEWEEKVHEWMQMNQKKKIRLESGLLEPSLSVEYFIYQTLLGTFPFDGKADEKYLQRIDEYLVKALREAKRKVSWRDPDETYENSVCDFVHNILDPKHEFLKAFIPFQQKVAWRGIINSLTQLTLKCTCPGIPDIYQGTELWDLTLVDPDNRQPVDYEMRHKALQSLIKKQKANPIALAGKLKENPFDGHIKLLLTYLLLNERKRNPDVFTSGKYIPVQVQGHLKNNIMAFARENRGDWLLVTVPLVTGNLSEKVNGDYFSDIIWKDTHILLPDDAPVRWTDICTLQEFNSRSKLKVSDLMKHNWVSILHNA
ncbi:MAG: malto-oligosyltrehalose synthase [Bacteroidales bacterium]